MHACKIMIILQALIKYVVVYNAIFDKRRPKEPKRLVIDYLIAAIMVS